MDTSHAPESFPRLLPRHRRRTGPIQRDLAAGRREWALDAAVGGGLKFPAAARLQQLTRAFLDAGGLMPGREMSEARGTTD